MTLSISNPPRTCMPDRNHAWTRNGREVILLALIVFMPRLSFSQNALVGIKLGVPLTTVAKATGEIAGFPFRAQTNRFVFGPVIDIRFSHGFALEVGAIYKRFDQQAGQVQK
jgi:hypothetical protein